LNRDQIRFPPEHEALRGDVHALGALVGEVLLEQGGQELFDLVEQDRRLAIRRRDGDAAAAAELLARSQGRPPPQARDLVRAFSTWFQGVNLAEKVHRTRRRRAYFLGGGTRSQPGGVEAALLALKEAGLGYEEVLELLGQVHIEPVFKAHPTESTRRTILRKQQRIAELLLDRLDPTLTPQDTRSLWSQVRMEITTGWQTEDHPRERLTVADEREHVLFYLSEVLYRVVPEFYEEIAQAIEKLFGVQAETLELPVIVRFGSWVGGDMDGNPDVHAKTLRETLVRQQHVVLNAYFEECQALAQILSQSASRVRVLPELQHRIEEYLVLLPSARTATPARHDRMPYRVFLAQVAERLRHTYDGRANGYETPLQLQKDVQLVADSLKANRGWNAGYLPVQRLLRRIATFGFHLAAIDVRQHAAVHHRVIARGLDDPAWMTRAPAERCAILADAIARDSSYRGELDALGKRTLGVFEAIMQCRHRYGPQSVGYYIVSGAASGDDVLGPLLLARWADAYDKRSGQVALDVAPLFESLEALEQSAAVMQGLLADPIYRRHVDARGRRQCVLVGYSDSNKEGGLCASRVATFKAQRSLAAALRAANEQHVIFHGRGGSVARGGGRTDALVRGAPSDALNGTLRMTEQGEVVNQSFGLPAIAMRTIERAFNVLVTAVGESRRGTLARENPHHLACAELLAARSRERYGRLVNGDARFLEFFRAATPIDVIERMQIGSRPAYRPGEPETFESLRAVPWVFAWTQTRCMIPGWYGLGTGLRAVIDTEGLERARECYAQWFFFRNLIDDAEAMLARTDFEIAAEYRALAAPAAQPCFEEIRREFLLSRAAVLELKGEEQLLDGDTTLQRAIALRNPYIDPMSLMQVDLLRRWRASGRVDRDLFQALLASISGIAEGLQSTG
jgi:phosphoenolpyruvate carboxylase